MSELVTDYMEGVLPLRTRLLARVHLIQCRACAAYYDQMHHTVRLLAAGKSQPNAPDIADQVVEKASQRRPDNDRA